MSKWIRWPDGTARIGFGGDYNPEQWPEEVWREDVVLMQEAGVNLVNLAIFSWSLIETSDNVFDFGWLDRAMDLLHDNGIAVDLATATASPPAWLVTAHPEMRPVTARGEVLGFGARQSWCPSSPVYRDYSLRLVNKLATHYADHPALALWHVSNELGCHNSRCYCEVSAAAFREWLGKRYTDVDAVNDAWGTAFWSQHYSDIGQIEPPRLAPTFPNPGQQLDYARFGSDALLEQLIAERDALVRITPDVPVTTNFMVMHTTKDLDYLEWGRHVDLVSNDHYLLEGDEEAHIELAFSADLTRGTARGRPWMLMEQSSSAVNWGQVNRPKAPGELRRNSLAQVARGADAISYFQWRASAAGAEKFHSAMLPHAGSGSRVFHEIASLGADLGNLREVIGSTVAAEVALLFDWPSWWASELDSHPSQQFRYRDVCLALYRELFRLGVTVDIVDVDKDLTGYKLVLVPALYLVSDETAARVAAVAASGATVVVTYFSGIVDADDHIRLGGYPGAFRDLLGVRVEEFGPLRPEAVVALDDDTQARLWTEDVQVDDAQVVASFTDGPFPGSPAITRRALPGGGAAWYLATLPSRKALRKLLRRIAEEAGMAPAATVDGELELTRRVAPDGASFLFALNHGSDSATLYAHGTDLLSGREVDGAIEVPAGDVVVVRATRP